MPLSQGHPATPQPLTTTDAVVLMVVLTPILLLLLWGVVRLRQGRAAVRAALARDHYDIVRMQFRWFSQGPFFWTTMRAEVVYRLLVRDQAGRERTGWARWGRRWPFAPDALELRWDEPER